MRISDWSSDVCSSDLFLEAVERMTARSTVRAVIKTDLDRHPVCAVVGPPQNDALARIDRRSCGDGCRLLIDLPWCRDDRAQQLPVLFAPAHTPEGMIFGRSGFAQEIGRAHV